MIGRLSEGNRIPAEYRLCLGIDAEKLLSNNNWASAVQKLLNYSFAPGVTNFRATPSIPGAHTMQFPP